MTKSIIPFESRIKGISEVRKDNFDLCLKRYAEVSRERGRSEYRILRLLRYRNGRKAKVSRSTFRDWVSILSVWTYYAEQDEYSSGREISQRFTIDVFEQISKLQAERTRHYLKLIKRLTAEYIKVDRARKEKIYFSLKPSRDSLNAELSGVADDLYQEIRGIEGIIEKCRSGDESYINKVCTVIWEDEFFKEVDDNINKMKEVIGKYGEIVSNVGKEDREERRLAVARKSIFFAIFLGLSSLIVTTASTALSSVLSLARISVNYPECDDVSYFDIAESILDFGRIVCEAEASEESGPDL